MNAASPTTPADDERAERPVGAEGAAHSGETASEEGTSAADSSAGTSEQGSAADADVPAFGAAKPTRFGADVAYRGRAGSHDYLLRVRHRLLDTSFTLVLDGVEHDPVAEEKAHKAADKAADKTADKTADKGAEKAAEDDAAEAEDVPAPVDEDPELSGPDAVGPGATGTDSAGGDDLRFRTEDGFTTLRCTVRRLDEDGDHEDSEILTVRTTGLGGAGEAEVRHGLKTTVLVPAEGSPSAVREAKRIAHPTRFALIAAVTRSAKFLLPLLGFGALFSGLLDPAKEWVEARIRPAVEAISRVVTPVLAWIDEVTRPVREFLDALFSPIREFFAALLRPVRDFLRWLRSLLPDISLPFDIPDWVFDIAVPVLIVLAVFFGTLVGIKHRRDKLETSRAATSGSAGASTGAGAAPDVSPATPSAAAEEPLGAPSDEPPDESIDESAEESTDEPAGGVPASSDEPDPPGTPPRDEA